MQHQLNQSEKLLPTLLGTCGMTSQGKIGIVESKCAIGVLEKENIDKDIVIAVTHILVGKNDLAFSRKAKLLEAY